MNETSASSSSSLAITEKRPTRPGGCVGIFFQLFHWNKRVAKKKLFSKKLLTPARLKRASKKVGGDEKLPTAKNLLIADENRGGFPNARNHDNVNADGSHEMRSPGLVARLMGLESIPAPLLEKQKKVSFYEGYHDQEKKSANSYDQEKKSADNHVQEKKTVYNYDQEKKSADNHVGRNSEFIGSNKEELNLEKGHGKLESRPQKLQKTGLFDRQPVTRFGAEALQFRSVLSQSKKHQPKLVSPVKNPRVRSGRNAARLMQAATKVLEPGLRATNRAKHALTYSVSMPKKVEVMTRGITALSLDSSKDSSYYSNGGKSLKGQSACRSCGNMYDVDFRSNVDGQSTGFASSTLDLVTAPSQGSGRCSLGPTESYLEQETDRSFRQLLDQSVPLASGANGKTWSQSKNTMDRRPFFREDQGEHRMSHHQYKSQREEPSSTAVKQRSPRQNQMMLAKDRVPPKSNSSYLQSRRVSSAVDAVNGAKDFVALNRNLRSCAQPRVPLKVQDSCKIGTESLTCDKQDDSSSVLKASVQKRRPMNDGSLVERTGFVTSYSTNQRNIKANILNGKGMGFNGRSLTHKCVKSRLPHQVERNTASGDKDTDVVSFTFSSPMKHHTGPIISTEMEEKPRDRAVLMGDSCKKLIFEERDGNPSSQKATLLRGDALGTLLEHKFKELTCQDGDDWQTGVNPSGRSIASILQELITALTTPKQTYQADGDCLVGFHQKDCLSDGVLGPSGNIPAHDHDHDLMVNTNKIFKAEAKPAVVSLGFPLAGDGNHRSPGSVLEASFSNDSFLSSSFDDSAGQKLHPDSMDCSNDLLSTDPDADLFDSATSLNLERARNLLIDFSNNISRVLSSTDLAAIGLTGFKLNHARDVILNTELLFGNAFQHNGNSTEDFLVAPLLDKLETLADTLWINPNGALDFMEAKEGNQLRRFLFDCVIECLDSKYSHYCNSGFWAWTKLPLHINSDFLMQEFYHEIRRWTTDVAGKILDEIIEREVSHSLQQWTDFEIEAYETSTEIENDILQVLVDEISIDLLG